MIDEDYSGTGGAVIMGGAGGIAATAVAAALALFSVSAANELWQPPAYAASASVAQRTFGASPTTGTLTTRAPTAAWAASTAYVLDPTSGGINRVINVGNLYQCRTAGTSAGSGGPTTQASDITDGTAHWTYEGPAPTTDVLTGSQIIGFVARGDQTTITTPQIPPTDNDGGTYTAISNTSYSGFPASFAGVFQRSPASNGKTGLTASAAWGNASGGDEVTVGFVELRGVLAGAPHTFSQVERSSATANVDTAANITTTVPCLILSFWFGNGNVLTGGTSHPATPLGGLQLIPGATALMAISGGYIQVAVGWRIEPAARAAFAESWQTTGEGAQLFTIAYALGAAAPIEDIDEAPRMVPVAAAALARAMPGGEDELPVAAAQAVVDEPDRPAPGGWVAAVGSARVGSLEDDLPVLVAAVVAEDEPLAAFAWRPTAGPLAPSADTDETPALHGGPDDTVWVPGAVAAMPWRSGLFGDPDEPPIPPFLSVDEEPWTTSRIAPVTFAAAVTDPTELLAVLTVAEEDAGPATVWAPVWRAAGTPDSDDLPVAAVFEIEDWTARAVPATSWRVAAAPDDDVVAVATAGIAEDDQAALRGASTAQWLAGGPTPEDDLPVAAAPAPELTEDDATPPAARASGWLARGVAGDDDFATPPALADDDSPPARSTSGWWSRPAAQTDDDLPVASPPVDFEPPPAAWSPAPWPRSPSPADDDPPLTPPVIVPIMDEVYAIALAPFAAPPLVWRTPVDDDPPLTAPLPFYPGVVPGSGAAYDGAAAPADIYPDPIPGNGGFYG